MIQCPTTTSSLFRRGSGAGSDNSIQQFNLDVHTYKGDSSLRCFHVRLADLDYKKLPNLWVRVIASSGSQLIGYLGFGSEKSTDAPALAREAKWDGTLDILIAAYGHRNKILLPVHDYSNRAATQS